MTNKLVLKNVDQFMADYKPTYQPIYPLFLPNSQQYTEEVGTVTNKRLEAVGDIRAKHITPKDTDIRQIAVREGSKIFKKYFLANQFSQSQLQDQSQNEDVVRQVLDEHHKHQDDLLLLGEGTSGGTVINNGLFWSGDPNYVLENSDQIDNAPDTQSQLYEGIVATVEAAKDIDGEKLVIVYGSTALSKLNSLFPEQAVSVKKALDEALSGVARVVRLPSAVTPSTVNGWMVVTTGQVKLHYVTLPQLRAQGVNEEKMYSWHNFLMGSTMVDVMTYGGIIRQPVTFE